MRTTMIKGATTLTRTLALAAPFLLAFPAPFLLAFPAPFLLAFPAKAGPTDIFETDERFTKLFVPGGLTADQVSAEARATSPMMRAKRFASRGADAKVDEVSANFIPKLSGTARYTRLSPINQPPLSMGSGSGSLVVINRAVTQAGPILASDSLLAIPVQAFTFPVFLDQWSFGGALAIPLSDYFMRFRDAIEATSGAAEVAKLEVESTAKKADLEARTVYYQYIRARAQSLVAVQASEAAAAHAADAQTAFKAGLISRADVLRAESAVVHVRLLVDRANNGVHLAGEALRTLMHSPNAELTIGENVLEPFARGDDDSSTNLLVEEALRERPEARGLAVGVRAAKHQKSLARAGFYPRLDLVGNGAYANPNQRIIPAKDEFIFTWDASVVASWSPSDAFSSAAQVSQAESKRLELDAQRDALADGIYLEITQTKTALREARTSLETTTLGMGSAAESYRVRREAFRAGKATLVEVDDAATDLTRSRLEFVDSHVALRVAALRLAYACGRGPKS